VLARAGAPGEPLPSARELVAAHRVSSLTVSRALATLVSEGLVVTEPGRGTFVASRQQARAASAGDLSWQCAALAERVVDDYGLGAVLGPSEPGLLPLSMGYLAEELQPTRALNSALGHAARRPGAWDRSPTTGIGALRSALATMIGVDAADVLVVPGGQAGLSAALRGLAPAGAPIIVESPTYPGILLLARTAGMRPVPVPVDEDGIRPDLLAEALERTGARIVYCQPTYANPTGTVMPAHRRAAVLDAVRTANAFVIEDDCARQLALAPAAPAPMVRDDPDGHVVHLTSLTKVAAPSLRIGALAARGPAAARLAALRAVDDFFVPVPLQETAVELLRSPSWPRHLTRLRRELLLRRDALLDALRTELPEVTVARVPDGGLHLWARLPDGADDVAVAQRCATRGLLVSPGRGYHAGEPPAPYLRLAYCGTGVAQLRRAVTILAEVLR
jgi:DNA-binding transcriptional MocR family regulator